MTFINLTGFEFETGEASCLECYTILVDVHFLTINNVLTGRLSVINASVIYDPVYIEVWDRYYSKNL